MALTLKLQLNNGHTMPAFGFGTWQSKPGEVGKAVREAINAGFRHIDCARVYRNEAEVGAALHDAVASGKVKRDELFVTSKLWNTDHAPEHVEAACRRTLKDLKLEYLDLYLIHWPVAWRHTAPDDLFQENDKGGNDPADVPLEVTYAAMERLVDLGLVRSIGVSNCNVAQLHSVLQHARIKPVTNQIEMHVALPQAELRALHKQHHMVTTAYCPLGIGMDDPSQGVLNNETIKAIAASAGMPPASMLLQWVLQHPDCAVLSKSVTPDRIRQNAAIALPALKPDILQALHAFAESAQIRVCNPEKFRPTGPTPFFA